MEEGVSVFLYRVYQNDNMRIPQGGRTLTNGRRQATKRLAFLLTPWGQGGSLQHQIAGWMMWAMEGNPVTDLLKFSNQVRPGRAVPPS